jgi:hypothetical protein
MRKILRTRGLEPLRNPECVLRNESDHSLPLSLALRASGLSEGERTERESRLRRSLEEGRGRGVIEELEGLAAGQPEGAAAWRAVSGGGSRRDRSPVLGADVPGDGHLVRSAGCRDRLSASCRPTALRDHPRSDLPLPAVGAPAPRTAGRGIAGQPMARVAAGVALPRLDPEGGRT